METMCNAEIIKDKPGNWKVDWMYNGQPWNEMKWVNGKPGRVKVHCYNHEAKDRSGN